MRAPLASLDWQAHVYGEVSASLRTSAGSRALPVNAFAWSEEAEAAGLAEDTSWARMPT
jgi:hypothetical protein